MSTNIWSQTLVVAAAVSVLGGWSPSEAQDTTQTSTPTIQELNDRQEGMNEQIQILQTDVDKLKKFKFSGYLQARWETGETQSDTVRVTGTPLVHTPANNERFYIRRARLKLTYDASPLSQAVVYIDGGTDRFVRLLEAYVLLMDPWTPEHSHSLTVGQFNVPFGYELERSSKDRELPERSRAENVLFPGERDRGAKIVSAWTPKIETVAAILNGGGINNVDYPNTDPTRSKDFVGRVRGSLGFMDAAVSGYWGKNTIGLTGPDVQTDKTRLGADAQFFYESPQLGGGTLRGEVYVGKDVNADSLSAIVVSAPPVRLIRPGRDPNHLATDFLGWYAMWVQNLGESFQAAARYEKYDPNTDLENDQFERISVGLNWFYGGLARVTVAYDAVTTEVPQTGGGTRDPKDNLWTVQFQHKF